MQLTGESGEHGGVGVVEVPRSCPGNFPLRNGVGEGGGGGVGEGGGVWGCRSVGEGQIAGAGSWGVNVDSVCSSTGARYQGRVTCEAGRGGDMRW